MLKAVGCTLSIRFDLWLDIKEVPIISYRMAIAGWCLGNPVTLLCQLGAVNFIASSRALWAEALVESSLCHFKFTYISFLLGMCQKSFGFFIHSYNDRLSNDKMKTHVWVWFHFKILKRSISPNRSLMMDYGRLWSGLFLLSFPSHPFSWP